MSRSALSHSTLSSQPKDSRPRLQLDILRFCGSLFNPGLAIETADLIGKETSTHPSCPVVARRAKSDEFNRGDI
jgi:hypothetical protein